MTHLDLLAELLEHYGLGVVVVEVRQVHQRLSHALVLRDSLRVLRRLPNDLPCIIELYHHIFSSSSVDRTTTTRTRENRYFSKVNTQKLDGVRGRGARKQANTKKNR